jgi:ABC-type branched-subunit amino acid transport system ATPase component
MPTSLGDRELADTCLSVTELTAGYGPSPVISDVTMSVGTGEVVCVLGPNGAGKSTLLKAVVGILSPTGGAVSFFGRAITGMRADLLARIGIGYVPQVRDVWGPLTVQENLELGAYGVRKSAVSQRVEEVLSMFPVLVPLRRLKASNLSGGQRKMLAIARVLAARPRLLILDEPTANLAPIVAHELLHDYVRSLAQGGTTVLFVEQRAVEALGVSDWSYVLVNGRVALSCRANQVLDRDDVGALFLGAVPSK